MHERVEDKLASIMTSDSDLSRKAGDVIRMLDLKYKGLRWISRLG